MTIKTIETHNLSDGTFCRITRYKGQYSYMHTSRGHLEAPTVVQGLSKALAYALLVIELKSDVMEIGQ